MSEWRGVLEAIRTGPAWGRYDMRPYWRARAYRDHAGEADVLARAHAFAAVLSSCALYAYDGDQDDHATPNYRYCEPETPGYAYDWDEAVWKMERYEGKSDASDA